MVAVNHHNDITVEKFKYILEERQKPQKERHFCDTLTRWRLPNGKCRNLIWIDAISHRFWLDWNTHTSTSTHTHTATHKATATPHRPADQRYRPKEYTTHDRWPPRSVPITASNDAIHLQTGMHSMPFPVEKFLIVFQNHFLSLEFMALSALPIPYDSSL